MSLNAIDQIAGQRYSVLLSQMRNENSQAVELSALDRTDNET